MERETIKGGHAQYMYQNLHRNFMIPQKINIQAYFMFEPGIFVKLRCLLSEWINQIQQFLVEPERQC